jgi:hypothetical protein
MDEGRDGESSMMSCQGLLPGSHNEGRDNTMDEERDGESSTTSCQGLLPGSRDERREPRRRVVDDEKTECGKEMYCHTPHSS